MSPSATKGTVIIRSCVDVGSAVAHCLFGAAYRVLIHDDPRPAHTRRGMAFTDALFEHKSQLAGPDVTSAHETDEVTSTPRPYVAPAAGTATVIVGFVLSIFTVSGLVAPYALKTTS